MAQDFTANPATSPLDVYTLDDLKQRRSHKWTKYAPDVVPMWVAEMDAAPVPAVVEVVNSMLVAGDLGYPGVPQGTAAGAREAARRDGHADYRLLPSYPAAYVAFARERWGLEVVSSQIRLMPDVMQGVAHAVAARGITRLVINTPVYPPFRQYPAEVGAQLIEAPLAKNGRIDFEQLEQAFAVADGFLLCNPHNPTGVAHTRDEMEQVFELAHRYSVHVIVDEIHAPLTSPRAALSRGEDPFVPALSVSGSERALVIFSAAKGFNLAGFKAALMIAGSNAVDVFKAVPATIPEGASTVAIAAHTAALVYGDQWLDSVREAIDDRREQLVQGLARIAPQASVMPAEATYFAWVDFSKVEIDGVPLGDNPATFFLNDARLAFNPGPTFGAGGEGYVRINLATSHDVVDEALRRIENALNRHTA